MARQAKQSGNEPVELVAAFGNAGGADIGNSDVGNGGSNPANADFIIVEPSELGGIAGSDSGSGNDSTGEPVRKRRGRKPGSVRNAKAQTLDIKGVEGILFSAHAMLAAITKTQELALDKDEALRLAEGIANVSRHYDVSTTQKTMDWGNLIMVCGMIYGTRLFAIRENRKAKKPVATNPTTAPSVDGKIIIPGVGAYDAVGGIPQ